MAIMYWQFFFPSEPIIQILGYILEEMKKNNIIVRTYVSVSSTEQNESVYKLDRGTQTVGTIHRVDMIQ